MTYRTSAEFDEALNEIVTPAWGSTEDRALLNSVAVRELKEWWADCLAEKYAQGFSQTFQRGLFSDAWSNGEFPSGEVEKRFAMLAKHAMKAVEDFRQTKESRTL